MIHLGAAQVGAVQIGWGSGWWGSDVLWSVFARKLSLKCDHLRNRPEPQGGLAQRDEVQMSLNRLIVLAVPWR